MARVSLALGVAAVGLALRRRAGFSFGQSPTSLDWFQVSRDQLGLLVEDPHLAVEALLTRDKDGKDETMSVALKPPFASVLPVIEEIEANYRSLATEHGVDPAQIDGPGGAIRVQTDGRSLKRAGIDFSGDWSVIGVGEIDQAQFLTILRDAFLTVECSADREVWRPYPNREMAVEVLQGHVDYDLRKGRPHDLVGMQFQSAQGAEAEAEGDASLSADAEAKGGTGTDAAPPVDPLGTAPLSAEGAAETREGTDDAEAGQGDASTGEKQPEASLQPPVAEQRNDETAEADTAEVKKPSGSQRKAKTQAADTAD